MDNPDLVIESDADWTKFQGGPPDLIVDPMVYRTADVYLRGRAGVEESIPGSDPDQVWYSLSDNIGSLASFFDALVLSERLPIIDYGVTFDSQIGFEQYDLYQRCNDGAGDSVLVSVHVMAPIYTQAKQAALDALDARPSLSPELTYSILRELSAFEYGWQPDLSALKSLPENEDEVTLLRFLFGGLLFGAYSQMTGAGHLIQPKRSRLFLAAALAVPSAGYEHERELFEELRKVVGQTEGMQEGYFQVDALPPVLPFLLSKDPDTPDDLLRLGLALRKKGAMRDYRAWRKQLVDDWRDKGRIDRSNERVIRKIVDRIQRELAPRGGATAELGLNAGLTGVGLGVGLPIPVGRLWGWISSQIPGRRYTKLLMRLQLAAHEYRRIDRHLHTLWQR